MKPYYQQDGITLYHGDALEILPTLPDVHIVATDPPYTFGLASTAEERKAGAWADLMNNAHWYGSWLSECRRLTVNQQGSCWVFTSWRSFPVLARAASQIRWPIESLCVWDKEWISTGSVRGLRTSYEMFAHKDFEIANRSTPDIWKAPWSSTKPHGHPCEKPSVLMARLIGESNARSVLDPFAGSGTTLHAAQRLGIPAIGIEAEERWCEVTVRRLQQPVLLGGSVLP